MAAKINMKKVKQITMYNNTLISFNISHSNTCSSNTLSSISIVFEVKPNNSKTFDRFNSVLIRSININS